MRKYFLTMAEPVAILTFMLLSSFSMPRVERYALKAKGSLQEWALAHMLQEDEDDTCQDPAIDEAYLQLLREKWHSLTPARFTAASSDCNADSGADTGIQYGTLLCYETHL